MDKYIKCSAFIEAVKDIPMWGSAAAMLADSISAADVVPVVRCENCAFSQSDGWICGGTTLMPPHQTFPDSFCECGVKMDRGVE